mgnify:CR=1 FL=1
MYYNFIQMKSFLCTLYSPITLWTKENMNKMNLKDII